MLIDMMKIKDGKNVNKTCGSCEHTDGLTYTTYPSQVKCTITGEYHFQNDICNIEFKPVKCGCWQWDGFVYDMPWQCSECGVFSEYESSYCPNCGAKMDGGARLEAPND